MSIHSEITRIGQGVSAAKTAITSKGGTVSTTSVDDLADEIATIPQGGGGGEKKDVNFYDYDGTFITGYSYDELASLTELPGLPSHPEKDIIATGWTSTLSQIKAVTSPNKLDVGAMYSPKVNGVASNATVLVIRPEKNVALNMTFSQSVSNGVTVDWGDGSTAETVAGTGVVNVTHTYTGTTAETNITLTPAEGCNLILGFNGTENKSMFGGTNAAGNPHIVRASIGKANIGNYAFYYMTALKEVTISSNVTSIGESAFQTCYALTSVVIPNSVTSIGISAFCYCNGLTSVVIPNSVTSIANSAFQYCQSLASVVIPSSVTSIGVSAFANCYTLTSVTIPNSVTSIGGTAFVYCYALTSVVIPSSVTSLGGGTPFPNCYSLADIKFKSRTSVTFSWWLSTDNRVKTLDFTDCKQVPTMSSGFLNGLKSYTDIVVPDNLYASWIVATNWSTKAGQIVKQSDYEGSAS